MNKDKPIKNQREKMQEKLLAYRTLESRVNSLLEKQNIFSSKVVEIQGTIDSIEGIDKNEEQDMLFPLGSAAYVKGSIEDKSKTIVEIGSGVALEKTRKEAVEILKKRKEEIQKAIEALQNDIKSASMMMRNIEAEAQEMMRKSQDDKFKVVSS
jgi:prefoldin alpha subunit